MEWRFRSGSIEPGVGERSVLSKLVPIALLVALAVAAVIQLRGPSDRLETEVFPSSTVAELTSTRPPTSSVNLPDVTSPEFDPEGPLPTSSVASDRETSTPTTQTTTTSATTVTISEPPSSAETTASTVTTPPSTGETTQPTEPPPTQTQPTLPSTSTETTAGQPPTTRRTTTTQADDDNGGGEG